MKYNVFEQMIERILKVDAKVSAAYDLGIDVIEFTEDYNTISSILLTEYYGQEGAGWVEWFIYEKINNPDLKAHDADGNEICYDLKSLWECVEELRKAPDFLGVDDEPKLTDEEKIDILKNIFGGGDA